MKMMNKYYSKERPYALSFFRCRLRELPLIKANYRKLSFPPQLIISGNFRQIIR